MVSLNGSGWLRSTRAQQQAIERNRNTTRAADFQES